MAALCEECDGCCRVFEVKEVSKPFGQACKHLGPTAFGPGCQIYSERPDACKHYVCVWLDSQRRGGEFRLNHDLRPDIAKCVLGWPWGTDRDVLHVYPYPEFPDAWKKSPVKEYLEMVLRRGKKFLVYVNSSHMVYAYGWPAPAVIIGSEDEFADVLQNIRLGAQPQSHGERV